MTNRTRRTHEQWQAINSQFIASGLRIGDFCEQKSIPYQSFYNWKKRNPAPFTSLAHEFIELSPPESLFKQPWTIVLKLGNGVELQLSQSS